MTSTATGTLASTPGSAACAPPSSACPETAALAAVTIPACWPSSPSPSGCAGTPREPGTAVAACSVRRDEELPAPSRSAGTGRSEGTKENQRHTTNLTAERSISHGTSWSAPVRTCRFPARGRLRAVGGLLAQKQQPEYREHQRDEAVALPVDRPDGRVRERGPVDQGERADDEDAGQLDADRRQRGQATAAPTASQPRRRHDVDHRREGRQEVGQRRLGELRGQLAPPSRRPPLTAGAPNALSSGTGGLPELHQPPDHDRHHGGGHRDHRARPPGGF